MDEFPSIFISEGDIYCCYFCQYKTSSVEKVLVHTLSNHDKDRQFSARKVIFDEHSGRSAYRSLHFNISIEEIEKRIEQGGTLVFDEDNIGFKRKESNVGTTIKKQDSETITDDYDLSKPIHQVINVMNEHGRKEDFIHTLQTAPQIFELACEKYYKDGLVV